MNINNSFNKFISRNFNGLSAHTLMQTLAEDLILSNAEVSNMVYVNVYRVFTGDASEEDMAVYDHIRSHIYGFSCSSQVYLDAGILDLSKVEEYVGLKFTQDDMDYLKESALDWYINNTITLNQFKLIVAM